MQRLLAILVGARRGHGGTRRQGRTHCLGATGTVCLGLLLSFVLAGCYLVPGPRGEVMVVPALPPVVVLNVEPYYVQGGYHYHYQNNAWYYSRTRTGTWAPLPRDRYPKEVQYKNRGGDRDDGRKPEHGRR